MTSARRVVAQITDPHVRAGMPESVLDLRAAVDAILELGRLVDAVLVTGDLADAGAAEEYAAVAAELGRLTQPVAIVPGNHDDRAVMRAAFGFPGAAADPIAATVELGGLRLIAADTSVPGENHGVLDVDWLKRQLAKDPRTPTLLALHHPPAPIGITELDELALEPASAAALAELLADAPQILAVVAGHVHRAAVGMFAGRPLITAPAAGPQLALDLIGGEIDYDCVDPPALLLHVVEGRSLASHVVPLAQRATGG